MCLVSVRVLAGYQHNEGCSVVLVFCSETYRIITKLPCGWYSTTVPFQVLTWATFFLPTYTDVRNMELAYTNSDIMHLINIFHIEWACIMYCTCRFLSPLSFGSTNPHLIHIGTETKQRTAVSCNRVLSEKSKHVGLHEYALYPCSKDLREVRLRMI